MANENTQRGVGMAKSSNLYVRIEPELKERAEAILSALGVPVSTAITMYYKQIVLQRGIPFKAKLPEPPLNVNCKTDAQLDAALEKGYAEAMDGHTIPLEQAFEDIREGLDGIELHEKASEAHKIIAGMEDVEAGRVTDGDAALSAIRDKNGS